MRRLAALAATLILGVPGVAEACRPIEPFVCHQYICFPEPVRPTPTAAKAAPHRGCPVRHVRVVHLLTGRTILVVTYNESER